MSDTPRTDEAELWGAPQYAEHITFEGCDCVVMPPEEYEALFEHARTLKRELAAVTAERDALRADARRYQWLRDKAPEKWATWADERDQDNCDSGEIDAAIDAAIAASKGKPNG